MHGFMMRPLRSSCLIPYMRIRSIHEDEVDAHDDAAAELAYGGFGVEDAAAIEGVDDAADTRFPGDCIHAHFRKHGAERANGQCCISKGEGALPSTLTCSWPLR